MKFLVICRPMTNSCDMLHVYYTHDSFSKSDKSDSSELNPRFQSYEKLKLENFKKFE